MHNVCPGCFCEQFFLLLFDYYFYSWCKFLLTFWRKGTKLCSWVSWGQVSDMEIRYTLQSVMSLSLNTLTVFWIFWMTLFTVDYVVNVCVVRICFTSLYFCEAFFMECFFFNKRSKKSGNTVFFWNCQFFNKPDKYLYPWKTFVQLSTQILSSHMSFFIWYGKFRWPWKAKSRNFRCRNDFFYKMSLQNLDSCSTSLANLNHKSEDVNFLKLILVVPEGCSLGKGS